ncbi:MAG: glycosyltransferase [Pyrinomonadaceae bacterium]|nr:glycosyltransferase [Pyrinomonadaceae bacterium]MBP6212691.1 glycosyltransferase [Pyrinomonadaceae bacterium]
MSTTVKSVHITNYYHKNSGGISTSYNNLLAAAERHQREIRLIVPGETDAVEDVNPYARIYYIAAKQSPIFDKRYRIIMPWQYMPGGSKMRKILLDEMPDIIEVTDKYTLSMIGPMIRMGKFKQIGRPMLVHFSCERMDDNIGSFLFGGKLGTWLARRLMGNYNFPSFDYHIANSAYTAEEFFLSVRAKDNPKRSQNFLNKCWRFFRSPRVPIEERIHVCPRGVDVWQFYPDRRSDETRRQMIERARVPETAILLLYAGRISPEKNVGLLVEMMKELVLDTSNDYRLLVAGAGPQAEWLKSQGDKLGKDKIIQLGHVDKDTLAGYYSNADIFVHPNPREPFGIAPLEAMASGVPTLAPNAGGILSYATNDNAWLVEPNGADFAAAVREIVGDDESRERKVELALRTALDNTREASTDNLLATYDKIYDDFLSRRELFTDAEAAKEFDYISLTEA